MVKEVETKKANQDRESHRNGNAYFWITGKLRVGYDGQAKHTRAEGQMCISGSNEAFRLHFLVLFG